MDPRHFFFVLDESESMDQYDNDDDEFSRWELVMNALDAFIQRRKDAFEPDLISVVYYSDKGRIIASNVPIDGIDDNIEKDFVR